MCVCGGVVEGAAVGCGFLCLWWIRNKIRKVRGLPPIHRCHGHKIMEFFKRLLKPNRRQR